MPRQINRPPGMRARRSRNGKTTYYLVSGDGTTLVLGENFEAACALWVQHQTSLVKLASPATALQLLSGFQLCSLPLADVRAATRRSNELKTLRSYFLECDDPNLDEIKGEADFLNWYLDDNRLGAPDSTIRLFRMVWQFASQLQLVTASCPWSSRDLHKVRLQAEAVDVVRQFASPPLKEFLEDLFVAKDLTAVSQPAHIDHCQTERLRVALSHAVTRATQMLRKAGRPDLLAPVYQLKIENLVALCDTRVIALCRPPGKILLNHQRSDIVASLKAVNSAKRGRVQLSAEVQNHVAYDSEKNSMPVYDLKDTPRVKR